MNDIHAFIEKARQKGKTDAEIRETLIAGGWNDKVVDSSLDGLEVPTPPQNQPSYSQKPMAVTHTSSTRGFEYSIMLISLWTVAISLALTIDSFISKIDNTTGGGFSDKLSLVVLIIFLPIFMTLFLRTKKFEEKDKSIRLDSSRKHSIQLTMLVSFVVGLGWTVDFVYSLLFGTSDSETKLQSALYFLVTILISGSIFAYYWADDHKKDTSD